MSKKKKQLKISSEAKTSFTFALVSIVIGIGCIIYGNLFYSNVVDDKDVVTGAKATITKVEKVSRGLSQSEKKLEEDKGKSKNEIEYEYSVTYTVEDGDKTYTYTDRKPYRDGGSKPAIGDTTTISYAIVNGEFTPHPETKGVNQFNICGWFLVILGGFAALIGFFIRK